MSAQGIDGIDGMRECEEGVHECCIVASVHDNLQFRLSQRIVGCEQLSCYG